MQMEISVVWFVGFLMTAMAIGIVIGCRWTGYLVKRHLGLDKKRFKIIEIIDRC